MGSGQVARQLGPNSPTLPSANIAPAGGYPEDHVPLVTCHAMATWE